MLLFLAKRDSDVISCVKIYSAYFCAYVPVLMLQITAYEDYGHKKNYVHLVTSKNVSSSIY